MENDVYNGQEKYKSGIFVAKDGTEIGDWKRAGWGYITYDAGFALSSNVAVMNLIDKYMTAEQLKNYYKKLGFGSKTGIELPSVSKNFFL
jgi:penicillin-binding protein 2B